MKHIWKLCMGCLLIALVLSGCSDSDESKDELPYEKQQGEVPENTVKEGSAVDESGKNAETRKSTEKDIEASEGMGDVQDVAEDEKAESGRFGVLSVSFDYEPIDKTNSNQFALWIEDVDGNYIKTLYVTKYTADGGFNEQPDCLPRWVSQSKIANTPLKEYDAVTSPTPEAGGIRAEWDGTDRGGSLMPAGDYRIMMELVYYDENRVLYTGHFTLGTDTGKVKMQVEETSELAKDQNMITNLKVKIE